jgi:parallel beta-helix repeat protein/predicted outer membrane repeat protein
MSVFLAAVFGGITWAGTVYVDDDGPADFNNIQAAIDDSSHGDIIIVNPGTYTGPGNRDIDYNGKAITIRSMDPNDPNVVAATIIDCSGTGAEPHRGFYFHNNEDTNSIIDGLTITNGHAYSGAAICCEASRPTITNCNITGNKAQTAGGAIYSGLHCRLTSPIPPPPPPPPPGSDEAESSQEILSDYDLFGPTIKNCTFSENRGSGLCIFESSSTLVNCIFRENSGIGMLAFVSSSTLVNCIFRENGYGGIHTLNSNTTLVDCTFSGNSSQYGGGMYNYERSNTTLINCTFTANRGEWEGGGIYNSDGSSTLLTNCIFTENSSFNGGGIYNRESFLTLDGCTFRNNSSDFEGGGGIYCEDSRPIIKNCTFIENTVLASGGGGIYLYRSPFHPPPPPFPPPPPGAGGEQSYREDLIDYNYPGSVIFNCTFTGNSARSGGGLVIDEPDSSVVNCIFTENSAEWGGGMSNSATNTSLTNCIFTENSAEWGGGISNTASYTSLTGCVFRNNSVQYRGGGISNLSNSNMVLTNSIFTGNSANIGGGIQL